MSRRPRRNHSAEFKAKVALDRFALVASFPATLTLSMGRGEPHACYRWLGVYKGVTIILAHRVNYSPAVISKHR